MAMCKQSLYRIATEECITQFAVGIVYMVCYTKQIFVGGVKRGFFTCFMVVKASKAVSESIEVKNYVRWFGNVARIAFRNNYLIQSLHGAAS
jgi:hypothetical protein